MCQSQGILSMSLCSNKLVLPWWLSDKRICLPMQETWVQSLGQEDLLEKEMATQYSCLGNPIDRGGRWAAVHGIASIPEEEGSQEKMMLLVT